LKIGQHYDLSALLVSSSLAMAMATMAASCCCVPVAAPPQLRASWSGLRPACVRSAPFRQLWNGLGRRIGTRGGEERRQRIRQVVVAGFLPVDPWAPNTDQQSVASSLFAASLFPYLGFLYHLTKSKTAPKLTLFGFYFLLAFVGATSNDSSLFIMSDSVISSKFSLPLKSSCCRFVVSTSAA
jgi:hypothetical protein